MTDERIEAVTYDESMTAFLAAAYNVNPDTAYAEAMEKIEVDAIGDEAFRKAFAMVKECAEASRGDEEKILDLKRDWTRLFRGVSPDYGPPAPYALGYLGSENPQQMAEMAKFYQQAGYCEFQEFHDRLDYIGVELDFMKTVNMLRKHSLGQGEEAEYERLTTLYDEFVEMWLASWFSDFYDKAGAHVRTDFYRGVLELTRMFVESRVEA